MLPSLTATFGHEINDWNSYCKTRGLDISSPFSILLSFPLTVSVL